MIILVILLIHKILESGVFMCNKKVKIIALGLAIVLVISAAAIYFTKQNTADEGQIIVDGITYNFVGSCPIIAEAFDDNGTKLMSAPSEDSRCILVMEKGAEFTDVGPVEGYSGWTYAEYDDGLTKHVGFVYVGE